MENGLVLVTGPDGLLGSNLVRKLIQRGYRVRAFVHPSSRATTLQDLPIQSFRGDIMKPETMDAAMAGCDAVVHAAALTNVWPSKSQIVRDVNIIGTANVVQTALQHGIKRFVYVGSASSVDMHPDSASNRLDYIHSKIEAMQVVFRAVSEQGLPALAVLPTFMIGPYDAQPSSGKILMEFAKGNLKFSSSGGRNFVHVSDVADAIVNGIESDIVGQAFVAGNTNMTYQEFLSRAAKILNVSAPVGSLPNFLVKMTGRAGSLYGQITGKKPMLSYDMACISCEKQFIKAATAVEGLKMPQTDIDEAIRDCYSWFRSAGYC